MNNRSFLIMLLITFSNNLSSAQVKNTEKFNILFQEAFDCYPEINPSRVKLVFRPKTNYVMQARPRVKGFFFGRRTYRVIVSSHEKYRGFLDTLSAEPIRGWFAHELGHIVDYQQRGRLGTVWLAVQYISSEKFRRNVELRTDICAIQHGCGYELVASVIAGNKSAYKSEAEKRRTTKQYASAQTLKNLILKMEQRE